jgi:hypothetical protein
VARSATSPCSRSHQTLDSTPAIPPICGQIGYSPCSRSRQDFGQLASDTSNLWPDRLRVHVAEVTRLWIAPRQYIQSVARSATTCVAEVAKTLDSAPAIPPICGQIGYEPCSRSHQTLDSASAIPPICGQIGYGAKHNYATRPLVTNIKTSSNVGSLS